MRKRSYLNGIFLLKSGWMKQRRRELLKVLATRRKLRPTKKVGVRKRRRRCLKNTT